MICLLSVSDREPHILPIVDVSAFIFQLSMGRRTNSRSHVCYLTKINVLQWQLCLDTEERKTNEKNILRVGALFSKKLVIADSRTLDGTDKNNDIIVDSMERRSSVNLHACFNFFSFSFCFSTFIVQRRLHSGKFFFFYRNALWIYTLIRSLRSSRQARHVGFQIWMEERSLSLSLSLSSLSFSLFLSLSLSLIVRLHRGEMNCSDKSATFFSCKNRGQHLPLFVYLSFCVWRNGFMFFLCK